MCSNLSTFINSISNRRLIYFHMLKVRKFRRRISEATRWTELDQLALSPQCGFASTCEGNRLSADDQWRKLKLVCDVARDVWR